MVKQRRFTIEEKARVSPLSLILGFGPVVLIAIGVITVWLVPARIQTETIDLTIVWAASILIFLGGVRRGLSFRTPGGATFVQISTSLTLFLLGILALLLITNGMPLLASISALLGYCLALVGDPIAAENGEAPLFFERLRPPQMLVSVLALGLLITWLLKFG